MADSWAAAQAEALVAAARADALAEARRILRERYVRALLAAAEEHERPGRPPRPPAPAALTGEGLWLYGVLPGTAPDPPALAGPDGRAPVRVVRHAELTALVAQVPLDTFGAEALQRDLEDMERLEHLARAHEHVLDAALELGPLVPFRLCTIYEGEESVREMLEREHADLTAALNRIEGKVELGVKAFARASQAREPEPAAATGIDYLTRKRTARDEAEAARDAADATVAEIHARLAEQADAAVLNAPQDRRLTGREEEMVLNAAYLVPQPRADAFRGLVASLAARHEADGLELELTGPWPAYHFAQAP